MYEYRAKTVKIVDGDTVDIDIDLGFGVWVRNQRIRLYKVDTPEKRTRNKIEKKAGLLATEKVTNLIPVGSTIVIKTHKDGKGKYGRILGELFNDDGVNVNEYLIKNRYGVAYYGQSKDEVKELHEANYRFLESKGEM
jgi:micrococcal nuclease